MTGVDDVAESAAQVGGGEVGAEEARAQEVSLREDGAAQVGLGEIGFARAAVDGGEARQLSAGEHAVVEDAVHEAEIVELLKGGYLGTVTYGFRRGGNWIEPTLRYTARDLAGTSANDDDPGRIRPGVDVSNSSFYSYLTYSLSWDSLCKSEKDAVKSRLPFIRSGVQEPGVNGYLIDDRTYSSGGRALNRSSVRSY